MGKENVDIVLPTYNGEIYICEQIESIINQSYKDWKLYVRDDFSRDNTLNIIKKYRDKYPGKIVIVEDEKGNLGVTNNVFEILKYTKERYVMFCDQDDVWNCDKIKTLIVYMKNKEMYVPNTPIMVHSDATVVDNQLNIIQKSFTELGRFNRTNSNLSNLLQFNIVQGATSIVNRELLDVAKRLSYLNVSKKTYHDWWFAILASCFGKIFYMDKSLMLYRQHNKNLVGVGYFKKKSLKEIFSEKGGEFKITNYSKVNKLLCRKLLDYYKNELSLKQIKVIHHFYYRPNDFIEFLELRLYKEYTIKEMFFMFLYGIE